MYFFKYISYSLLFPVFLFLHGFIQMRRRNENAHIFVLFLLLIKGIICSRLYPHPESLTDILLENMLFEEHYEENKVIGLSSDGTHSHRDLEDDIGSDVSNSKFSYRHGSNHRCVDYNEAVMESLVSSSSSSSSSSCSSSIADPHSSISSRYSSDATTLSIPS